MATGIFFKNWALTLENMLEAIGITLYLVLFAFSGHGCMFA